MNKRIARKVNERIIVKIKKGPDCKSEAIPNPSDPSNPFASTMKYHPVKSLGTYLNELNHMMDESTGHVSNVFNTYFHGKHLNAKHGKISFNDIENIYNKLGNKLISSKELKAKALMNKFGFTNPFALSRSMMRVLQLENKISKREHK